MKDFFGNELKIGDEVAFEAPRYRRLTLGKIIAFTPQQIRVEFNNTWNYGKEGRIETYLMQSNSCIKKG